MKDLELLNSKIETFETYEIDDTVTSSNICFIVGLPRVGSTLLHQVLISRYRLGYISNIIGKFWKNPVAGAILHQSLYENDYISNFYSEYGNTRGPFEPCEFGWFWKPTLNIVNEVEALGPNIDWEELRRVMQCLLSVFKEPIIFDTPFVCGNIFELKQHLNSVKVIHVTRDPWSVCNSILAARQKRYGDINQYYGAKPKSWQKIKKIKDPIRQAVMQVYDLKNEIEEDLLKINPGNIYQVDVSTVRQYPEIVADEIAEFLQVNNRPRSVTYPTFADRDRVPIFDENYEKAFRMAWDSIFGKLE